MDDPERVSSVGIAVKGLSATFSWRDVSLKMPSTPSFSFFDSNSVLELKLIVSRRLVLVGYQSESRGNVD